MAVMTQLWNRAPNPLSLCSLVTRCTRIAAIVQVKLQALPLGVLAVTFVRLFNQPTRFHEEPNTVQNGCSRA
jgi:hypothetical protein